jgi:hypothetical protein
MRVKVLSLRPSTIAFSVGEAVDSGREYEPSNGA